MRLSATSARIGADPALVQGPGGNTSLKIGSSLWVKASGVWLAEAMDRPIFVPIDLEQLRSGDEPFADAQGAVIADRNTYGLRPSIETWLHALMPHPAVVHAHAVNAMAISVRTDGERLAATRLDGLAWAWVGYQRPGVPLARAVEAAIASAPVDILLLENHGIVVGGETIEAAESLLHDAERRLAMPRRALPAPDRSRLDALATAEFEPHARASGAALDRDALALLTGAPLLPDQVVFLGGAVPTVAEGEDVAAAAARIEVATSVVPVLFLVPGVGALAQRTRSPSADSLIEGLVEIACRLPSGTATKGLSAEQTGELLNWDAERYRQALNTR